MRFNYQANCAIGLRIPDICNMFREQNYLKAWEVLLLECETGQRMSDEEWDRLVNYCGFAIINNGRCVCKEVEEIKK